MGDNDVTLDDVRSWLLTVQDQAAPSLDLDELLRTGRQHRRRRRTLAGLAAAAAVVLLAGGGVAVFGLPRATPPAATNPGATASSTESESPSPTTTDTSPSQPVPVSVPGYSYREPTGSELGGFDLQRSVRQSAENIGAPITGAVVNEVIKDGQPQGVLVVQYSVGGANMQHAVPSVDGDKLVGALITLGFATLEPGGTGLVVDRIDGVQAYHSTGPVTFYFWGSAGEYTGVAGKNASATDAFVADYIKAQNQLP